MSIFQAAVLGFIQGLTEFLPVSSSGHLVLIPEILGWDLQPLYFDVALHWGTLFAVAFYFWQDWKDIFASLRKNWKFDEKDFKKYPIETRLSILIGIGTIPAVIVGFLFQNFIEQKLRSPWVVVVMLVLVAVLMWWVENKPKVIRSLKGLTLFDGVFIGLAQMIALIPGTSRSGITITAGIFRGLSREDAARFSFLLSTPVIFGAGIYEALKVLTKDLGQIEFVPLTIGFFVSMVTGFLAIKFLMRFLKKQKLTVFVVYRIVLAVVVFGVLVIR